MKKTIYFLLPAAALLLMFASFRTTEHHAIQPAAQDEEFVIPEDVSAIFDKSCFGCHNVDAKSDKAKKKLLIDQMGQLSKAKLVGKLGEIGEVVSKNEMPPEKFIQKYPDKKLTEEESIRLVEWTEEAANNLMK
jgi:hypothetical protein